MLPEALQFEAKPQYLSGKRDQNFYSVQIFCFKKIKSETLGSANSIIRKLVVLSVQS